ncbi:MAG: ATP-binding protein [Burkholderiaceae bacterium]
MSEPSAVSTSVEADSGNGRTQDSAAAPARRSWSLRSRLLWLACLTTLIAWLAGGVGILVAAYNQGEKLYDDQLRAVAHVILSFANHEIAEIRAEGRSDIHLESATRLDLRYDYQIWSKDGELLLFSDHASRQPYAPLQRKGLLDREIGGRPHRVYSLPSDDGTMLIQVAEDESLRTLFKPSFGLWEVGFFLIPLLLLLTLNRWVFERVVLALDESAQQLTDRSSHDLRPMPTDGLPRELQPLVNSVNGLFRRIVRTLDAERRFTAAAAHELRTPLTVIRMQAQAADRASTPQGARVALTALVSCVDRASRMVDQLLTLAHVESLAPKSSVFVPVRLDRVIEQVVADLSYALTERNIRVDLQLDSATVPAIEFGVAALIRNLIDNALQHASRGGRVLVRTFVREDEVVMTVEDAGPGIPEAERTRVFERFYRLPESETGGYGVGLSIVQCVADAHHAHVALDSVTRGGLRVTVIFPGK